MTTAEVLRKARALIEDPVHWTKGADARRVDGDECEPLNSDAVCFCARGAIVATGGPDGPIHEAIGVLHLVALNEDLRVIEWNDRPERTHAEVLAAFDRAIEAAS